MDELFVRRVVTGPISENAYFVGLPGRGDAAVIDPGDECARLLDALKQAGRSLGAILLTHGHFDHITAAAHLREATGAPVYIHPSDAQMLAAPENCLWTRGMTYDAFRAANSDYPAAAGDLTVCGLRFTVIETPGHTPGGVCYYLKDYGALFCGDTLFAQGYGRTDLPGGDMQALVRSLRALVKLPSGTRIYPGHGGESTLGAAAEVLFG